MRDKTPCKYCSATSDSREPVVASRFIDVLREDLRGLSVPPVLRVDGTPSVSPTDAPRVVHSNSDHNMGCVGGGGSYRTRERWGWALVAGPSRDGRGRRGRDVATRTSSREARWRDGRTCGRASRYQRGAVVELQPLPWSRHQEGRPPVGDVLRLYDGPDRTRHSALASQICAQVLPERHTWPSEREVPRWKPTRTLSLREPRLPVQVTTWTGAPQLVSQTSKPSPAYSQLLAALRVPPPLAV